MRHLRVWTWLCCLAVLGAAGCTIAAPPGAPTPPSAQVLPADARALAYGATVGDVLQNQKVGDKIRELFGPDWLPAASGRGQLALGASAYFGRGGPLQMVRIGHADYVAASACAPSACDGQRVLLLIEEDGSRLFARIDEGGFVHYYSYGSEGITRDTAPLVVDSGFRALHPAGQPYPR